MNNIWHVIQYFELKQLDMKNIKSDLIISFFVIKWTRILRSFCQKIFNIGLLCMSYINMNIFNQYDNKLDFLKLIDH